MSQITNDEKAERIVESFKPLADAANRIRESMAWNNYPIHLRLNDRIVVNGRVGTICYSSLDGCGGVWGEHTFDTTDRNSWREDLPAPEFMLRDKRFEARWRKDGSHRPDVECVGHYFEYVEDER